MFLTVEFTLISQIAGDDFLESLKRKDKTIVERCKKNKKNNNNRRRRKDRQGI